MKAPMSKVRQLENRKRLAQATTDYFERLDARSMMEENMLAHDMMSATKSIAFDQEV